MNKIEIGPRTRPTSRRLCITILFVSSLVHIATAQAISIASGWGHNLILRDEGTLWSWGTNWEGQLGDGNAVNKSAPVRIAGLHDVVGIAGGFLHSLAVQTDGSVWAWGSNVDGQLGD